MSWLKAAQSWIKRVAKGLHEAIADMDWDFSLNPHPYPKYTHNQWKVKLEESKKQLDMMMTAEFILTLLRLRLADEEKDKLILNQSHRYMLECMAKQFGVDIRKIFNSDDK